MTLRFASHLLLPCHYVTIELAAAMGCISNAAEVDYDLPLNLMIRCILATNDLHSAILTSKIDGSCGWEEGQMTLSL